MGEFGLEREDATMTTSGIRLYICYTHLLVQLLALFL